MVHPLCRGKSSSSGRPHLDELIAQSSVKVPEDAVGVDIVSRNKPEAAVPEELQAFIRIASIAKKNQVVSTASNGV